MNILLVDDSSTIRTMYIQILSRVFDGSCRFLEAANGQEAMQIIENNSNIELILLDFNMPIMRGDEFLVKLRNIPKFNKTKVIMSSTEAAKETVMKLMKIGVNGYIVKPFNRAKFENAITHAFRGRERCTQVAS